jgi:hypothetical protein
MLSGPALASGKRENGNIGSRPHESARWIHWRQSPEIAVVEPPAGLPDISDCRQEQRRIAVILNLSSRTVNAYLRSAEQKLGVVNRVQAVTAACRLPVI